MNPMFNIKTRSDDLVEFAGRAVHPDTLSDLFDEAALVARDLVKGGDLDKRDYSEYVLKQVTDWLDSQS